MIAITSFLDRLRREVGGCPEPIMIDAMRDSAREFCAKSQVWRENLENISTVENGAEYDIEVPAKTRSVAIIGMTHHGLQVVPKSEQELDDIYFNWRSLAATTSQFFVSDNPEILRLVPYPSATEMDAIQNVRVALQPTNIADQLPEILHRDYLEQLSFGALARIFMIDRQTWTNANLAGIYEKKFNMALTDAKLRALKNYQNSIISVRERRLPGAP